MKTIYENGLVWLVVAVSFLISAYLIVGAIDCAFESVSEAVQKAVNPHGGLN